MLSPSPTTSGPLLRPSVIAAKQKLTEGREKLRAQHESGSPGIQVCARLTELLDDVVISIYRAALADLDAAAAQHLEANIALIPYGGFGRRDVAPFSDVDLMLLHTPLVSREVVAFTKRLMVDIGDVGLVLGYATRTPEQAMTMSVGDATILTSLAEARLLVGSEELFERFTQKFKRYVMRRWRRLIPAIEEARRDERAKFGESVYLLEPNIKRSRGALRDIQLVRWIGFVRYGEVEPEALWRAEHLSKEDYRALREASEFLLRLRNELHFAAGRGHDGLDRSEQLRIAERFGYASSAGVLPVERFMQDYFRHTSEVRNIAAHFVRSARPNSFAAAILEPLMGHLVEGDFRVGPQYISATRRGLSKLNGDVSQVLRLMDLANLYNKRIDHRTWETIRATMTAATRVDLPPDAIRRFLSLLSQPAQLGEMLRRLHELRVLEKIVPEFNYARCLLQFNEYHKLTVDAHCIRAVEAATEFAKRTDALGEVYRSIKQKRILHLALLLHDLGKGRPEDHSELGREIAIETARRFHLTERESETLAFLVHKHLVMSHLAFRRDTSEEEAVVKFAVEVGSPDVLKMLYVLTCADLGAVGPGVLNDWKVQVLTGLYRRTMLYLAGDSTAGTETRLHDRCEKIRKLAQVEDTAWLERQIAALPSSYLSSNSSPTIAQDLAELSRLAPQSAAAWGRYLDDHRVLEFAIGSYEQIAPGLFHRLTGALTSHRLQILSAEINTLADGLVLDRFWVQDEEYAGQPPPERLESIYGSLVQAACDETNTPPKFRRTWHDKTNEQGTFTRLPTQVRVDNDTSERFTVIDVFAHDRMGLLYSITRTLFECGVSVSVAKIGTHLDQVVDVFYVADQATGKKLEDEARIAELRKRLLGAIDG